MSLMTNLSPLPVPARTTGDRAPNPDRVPACAAPAARRDPVLEVVVPVYNEQHTLDRCVRTLHAHLRAGFPLPFAITVADNASTDHTLDVARGLAAEFAEVEVRHLDEKGRGRALDAAWSASTADVLCYLDVDLSTDLAALFPLVAPLVSGHSDLAIGTRLARGSRVVRGRKREVISRCYNVIVSTLLRARFSDAQCGFKAIRADAAAELLPLVRDRSWFFDTELLVLAERAGLRIHEVPVDWVDDPDSRVDIVRTALDDLRGCLRVERSLLARELPLDGIAERLGRRRPGEAADQRTAAAFRIAAGAGAGAVAVGVLAVVLPEAGGLVLAAVGGVAVAASVITGLARLPLPGWISALRHPVEPRPAVGPATRPESTSTTFPALLEEVAR